MKSEFFFFQIIKIYFFPYLFTQSDLIIVQFIPDKIHRYIIVTI